MRKEKNVSAIHATSMRGICARGVALDKAHARAIRVATYRADMHKDPRSAIRRSGATWAAWARVA